MKLDHRSTKGLLLISRNNVIGCFSSFISSYLYNFVNKETFKIKIFVHHQDHSLLFQLSAVNYINHISILTSSLKLCPS